MAKLKKIVLIALVVAMVALVGLALASCSPSKDDTPDNGNGGSSNGGLSNDGYVLEIETVYTLAKEAGFTGTLEDLIELFKGAQGEKGKDGIDGEKGNGIVKIEMNANGEFVVTYTDGTTQTVKVPECAHDYVWEDLVSNCKTHWQIGTCSICGDVQLQAAKVDGNHLYIDNVCTICGDITYSKGLQYALNNDGASYSVTGIGNCLDVKIFIPSTYNSLPITSIDDQAFYGHSGLVSITIPDSVTTIGSSAFAECNGLTSVTIGSSVTFIGDGAFDECRSLTSITIPDSVTSIGDMAFHACISLTSVTIGNSVTSIGNYAFGDCYNLTSATIGNRVASIGENAFSNCDILANITIPDSVTSIGNYSFENCRGLMSINLGNGVTSIGQYAFHNCSSLTSITIPNSVTSIDYQAFYGCYKLIEVYNQSHLNIGLRSVDLGYIGYYAYNVYTPTSGQSRLSTDDNGFVIYTDKSERMLIAYTGNSTAITIPNTITQIYERTFYGCTGLTSVTIPNSVTSIGNSAFQYCSGLKSITLPFVGAKINGSGNTHFGYIFGAPDYKSDSNFYIPSDLTTVVITGGDSIDTHAFYNCNGLTSITISDSVHAIGYGAFNGCDSLTSITLPFVGAKLNKPNNKYFGYIFEASSYSEQSRYIPSSLKNVVITGGDSIDTYAFYGCNGLTSITIPDSVTSIGGAAFSDCDSLTSITLPFVGAKLNGTSNTHFGYIFGALSRSGQNAYIPFSLTTVVVTGGNSIDESAFDGCNGLTSVTIGNGVTSIGKGAFSGCSGLTSITLPFVGAELNGTENTHFGYIFGASDYSEQSHYIPSCLKTVVITGGDSIDTDAFFMCNGLTNIIIHDGVTSIGKGAFSGCENLTSITLPFVGAELNGTSNTHFGYIFGSSDYGGNGSPFNLKTVVITGGDSIDTYAFYNCNGLTSITIPDSVTSIGECAFWECRGLTSITIPNGVTSIDDGTFSGCSSLTNITIPDSVASIGQHAFSGCSGLTSITIPDGVTSIEECTFEVCYALTSITIPDSVTSIGRNAFSHCSKLTSVTIGNGVTSIGEDAFRDCSSLTSITIPDSVTSIGGGAFYGCTGLTSITLPFVGEELNGWGSKNFGYIFGAIGHDQNKDYVPFNLTTVVITGGSFIDQYAFHNCYSLINITLPNTVTSIKERAFYSCSSLTNITIPDSVTSIGNRAFFGCGITNITLPSSITSIEEYTFAGCSKLTSLTIPDNVTSIGGAAFEHCSGLTSVIIGNGVTSIEGSPFYGCYKLIEVYNQSALEIEAGSASNGGIGYYAKNVYTPMSGQSKLSTDDNGFVIYTDGEEKILVAYTGNSTAITIPNTITQIYDHAFYGCTGLTSVTIGNGVTSIDDYAFSGCTGLTSIIFNGTEEEWNAIKRYDSWNENTGDYTITFKGGAQSGEDEGDSSDDATYSKGLVYALNDDGESYSVTGIGTCTDKNIVIPSKYNNLPVTSIGKNTFYNCTGLTSITIPDSVTSIGEYAFSGCSGLTGITIGNGVTSIGYHAFTDCSSLTEVYITDITAWCNISFVNAVANPLNYAKKLYLNNVLVTDLVIPNNVTSIGKYAFYDYTGLTSVTIPSSVTAIDDYAFRGCSGLTTLTIPNSVTSVGVAAFTGCSGLTSVTIGNGITSIGDYMFPGCTGLTSIVIPDSVSSIGEFAFYNCTAITSVTIPSGVTSIGKGAFYNCTDLASITFNGTEEEWNAITVGDSWDVCMGMGEYVVKCTDVELVVTNVAEWILNDEVTFDKTGVSKTTFSIVPADEATSGSVYTYILNIIDEDETSEIARIELKSDATVTMEFDEGGISGTWTESDGLITIKWDTEDSE